MKGKNRESVDRKRLSKKQGEQIFSQSVHHQKNLNTLMKRQIQTCRHNQQWCMKEMSLNRLTSLSAEQCGKQSSDLTIPMMNISDIEV